MKASAQPRTGNFDATAGWYDALAKLVYGKALRQAQTCYLNRIPKGASVLIIGGGTGWILEALLACADPASVLYLEASSAMLTKAKRRKLRKGCEIEFRLGTELDLSATESFDATCTFCFLDLFPAADLPQLIAKLKSALHPGGHWLIADFYTDANSPAWQRSLLWLMYFGFGVFTGLNNRRLPDYMGALIDAGLKPVAEQYFYNRFIRSGLYER